tara:strand:+ start:845 stop:1330 length:486 start_codon:yes stop_codon:yes gene_type:complete
MNEQMNPSRGALADMLTGRRGLNAGSAEALVRKIGQPPQTALPQSQPQTGMPSMPSSGGDMQLVTGRDGNKYQVVIDPKTGLQTFIPYREPAQQPQQPNQMMMKKMPFQIPQGPMPNPGEMVKKMPFQIPQGPMPSSEEYIQKLGQGGQGLTNRLRNMLSS